MSDDELNDGSVVENEIKNEIKNELDSETDELYDATDIVGGAPTDIPSTIPIPIGISGPAPGHSSALYFTSDMSTSFPPDPNQPSINASTPLQLTLGVQPGATTTPTLNVTFTSASGHGQIAGLPANLAAGTSVTITPTVADTYTITARTTGLQGVIQFTAV